VCSLSCRTGSQAALRRANLKTSDLRRRQEPVNPANNYGYERTLELPDIGAAVAALEPFAIESAAEKAVLQRDNRIRVRAIHAKAPEHTRRIHLLRRLRDTPGRPRAGRGRFR
jgi:hypothetical protein